MFSRGYKSVRDKIGKGSKFTRSCYNCEYYYKAEGDEEELCQNSAVLQFDMVVTENNVSCCYWELCKGVKKNEATEKEEPKTRKRNRKRFRW